MSEPTPESAASAAPEETFVGDDAEPSMEDILASIRKIISDDSDPVPLDSPAAVDVSIVDTAETVTVEPVDEVDLDLGAMLSDMDVMDPGPSNPASDETVAFEDVVSSDQSLDIPDIEMDEEAPSELLELPQDDGDDLVSELLADLDDPVEDMAPVAASVAAAPASDDADMDLVKSLMEDLTDEDVAPEVVEPEVLEEDTAAEAVAEEEKDELDAMEEDIFDSILDMTIDDELQSFDAETEIVADVPSLEDIAASAEAEAQPDAAPLEATPVVAAAAAAVAVTAAKSEPESTEIETTASDVDASEPTNPATPAPSEMETPMQSAVRSDAILDDVTETATMNAFAELNQVVEDKAVFAERGPRIGDLVQDALRPMLKEWLDENLQGIVERAVAKEVKRIASGK